jgi:protein-S-isoprenylcysteine O-methyltransferase Ste14
MWAVARSLPLGRFAFEFQRSIAIVLLSVGLLLMAAAVWALGQARTTVNPLQPERASRLVTHGIFALSRNPIYLGDVLILAAWVMWLGVAFNFALLALFVLWIDWIQIRAEERALHQLFREDYAAYCTRVRRWL